MNTLVDIQSKNNFETDKNSRHSYLKYYDEWFFSFKDKKIKLLEMGVFTGGSLMLWNEYFSNCTLFGIDINLLEIKYNMLFNQSNVFIIPKNFDTLTENFMGDILFDIIIDDGSHTLDHQIKALQIFKNKLNPGGILIIEDVSSYYLNYTYFRQHLHEINNCTLVDLRKDNGIEDNILLVYKHPL